MNGKPESSTCKNLLSNEKLGIILWDKNKELTHLNKRALSITEGKLKKGTSWYNILIKQLVSGEFGGKSIKDTLTPQLKDIWNEGLSIDPKDDKALQDWVTKYGSARLKQAGTPPSWGYRRVSRRMPAPSQMHALAPEPQRSPKRMRGLPFPFTFIFPLRPWDHATLCDHGTLRP